MSINNVIANTIKQRVQSSTYKAPPSLVTKNGQGQALQMAHENFDVTNTTASYLQTYLLQMAEEDRMRGDNDRANNWVKLAQQVT